MTGTHDFYFTQIINYSSKSIQVMLGYTNKKGELKESNIWWIPKKFINSIDFNAGIIRVSHYYLKVNGWAWRYQTHKALKRPNKVEIWIWTFYSEPDSDMKHLDAGHLDKITLIWSINEYDRDDYCINCKQPLQSQRNFSGNYDCKSCNDERDAFLLDKHYVGF